MRGVTRTPFQVVRYLMDFERVTVTQVAEDLGIARQNARKWLNAAVAEGVAVKAEPVRVYKNLAPTYALHRPTNGVLMSERIG